MPCPPAALNSWPRFGGAFSSSILFLRPCVAYAIMLGTTAVVSFAGDRLLQVSGPNTSLSISVSWDTTNITEVRLQNGCDIIFTRLQ
jgi:hypothetical protein